MSILLYIAGCMLGARYKRDLTDYLLALRILQQKDAL